ncbi:heat shock protein [hydrothermal vent metagenome]|uniref:Heat shock protein n=1 Tax=hydrothermal vent metagenome TaxID=652676 RepID=A0A1W1CF77_9ZZZZ
MDKIVEDIHRALDILELPTLISKKDIQKQYRYLAKKYHPDLSKESDKMEMINSSYELLSRYIDEFRYTFSDEEIGRQFPGVDYAKRFRP